MWPHVVRSLAWWWMDSRNTLGPVGLCCFILTIFRLVTYFNSARAMVRENQPILAIPATNINSRRPCHDLGVGRFSLSDMPNTILPHGLSTVIGRLHQKRTIASITITLFRFCLDDLSPNVSRSVCMYEYMLHVFLLGKTELLCNYMSCCWCFQLTTFL